jgi:hypothetical protein
MFRLVNCIKTHPKKFVAGASIVGIGTTMAATNPSDDELEYHNAKIKNYYLFKTANYIGHESTWIDDNGEIVFEDNGNNNTLIEDIVHEVNYIGLFGNWWKYSGYVTFMPVDSIYKN